MSVLGLEARRACLPAVLLCAFSGCSLLVDPQTRRGAGPDAGDIDGDAPLAGCIETPFPQATYTEFCFDEYMPSTYEFLNATAGDPNLLRMILASNDSAKLNVNESTLVLSEKRARGEAPDEGLGQACAAASAFSAEMIVRQASSQDPEADMQTRRLLDLRSSTIPVFVLGTNGPGTELRVRSTNGDTAEYVGNTPLLVGRATHIVVSSDGDGWQLFVNGSRLERTTKPAPVTDWDGTVVEELTIRIGDVPFALPNRSWSGQIGFVGIYCAEMGIDLVAQRYEAYATQLDR